MNSPKKRSAVSTLVDEGLHPGMPEKKRKSQLQRMEERYPSLFSAQDGNTDEETEMGYESSWLGIFKSTRG
jgi:hypothetical protein